MIDTADLLADVYIAASNLAEVTGLFEDEQADAEALCVFYALTITARHRLLAHMKAHPAAPRVCVDALDLAGAALNCADDAHRALTGAWVPIEVM